jgi:precorrin-4 methylase
MSNYTPDAGIPVLTEIIPASQPVSGAGATVAAATMPAVTEKAAVVSLDAGAVPVRNEEQWNRLEREVTERVLYQVLERIDFVLEQRVRDNLADVLQTAVERLATDIKSGLEQSLKEIVTRAVTQEITRLQSEKK